MGGREAGDAAYARPSQHLTVWLSTAPLMHALLRHVFSGHSRRCVLSPHPAPARSQHMYTCRISRPCSGARTCVAPRKTRRVDGRSAVARAVACTRSSLCPCVVVSRAGGLGTHQARACSAHGARARAWVHGPQLDVQLEVSTHSPHGWSSSGELLVQASELQARQGRASKERCSANNDDAAARLPRGRAPTF